jgi:hypothetical protein
MIKVFDILTEQYYPFEDFSEATTNIGMLGRSQNISSIGTVGGTDTRVTITGHGYITGQTIGVSETTNYDGTYTVTRIDANNFYLDDCDYVSPETSGICNPIMDSSYYVVFLHNIETIF